MIKVTGNTETLCALCSNPASAPLHDPCYGAHEFQAPPGSITPVPETIGASACLGNLYVYTQRYRYYVVYWWDTGTGWTIGRCFITREGPIETEDDISRVQHAIEDGKASPLRNSIFLLNWKRIS